MPLVVVTDMQGTHPIMGFSAKDNDTNSVKKLARNLKKKLKENPALLTGDGNSNTKKNSNQKEERRLLADTREWTNSKGMTIIASVIAVDDVNVTFLLNDDKEVRYPLEKLSEESAARLGNLR